MMDEIKRIVKSIPIIGNLAGRLYRKPKILAADSPVYWINKCAKNIDLNIVQIGSNDGKTGDPLIDLIYKNKNWKILFVEPVPYLFKNLKSNYPVDPRFTFENAAINDGSKQTFYWVKKEAKENIDGLPNWYDQLGSFQRDHLVKHLDGILEPFIVETDIQGITLSELLRKNNIGSLDILHIDTEGYDWKILSQLDLNKFSPILILFEHKHLPANEKEEAVNFLKGLYHIFQFGQDFLCIRIKDNNLQKSELSMLTKKNSISQ
ncbi:MAG: FkbM family methyltransferase [Ferruginibacter sp.]